MHPTWLAWFLPTWRSVPLITLGFCPYLMVGSSHQDGWCPSHRLDHPSIDYPGPVATRRCSLEKFRSAHLSCVCCVCNTWKLPSRELYNVSRLKVAGKMIFLFNRWDVLVPRRVIVYQFKHITFLNKLWLQLTCNSLLKNLTFLETSCGCKAGYTIYTIYINDAFLFRCIITHYTHSSWLTLSILKHGNPIRYFKWWCPTCQEK